MENNNDLAKFLLNGLKTIVQYIAGAIRKNIVLVIVFFLLIGAYNIYNARRGSDYYKGTMACYFHTLTFKTYGEMVVNLNLLAKTGSYNQLANALNISLDNAKTIISIEGTNSYHMPLQDDFSTDKGPMYITVTGTTENIFPVLEVSLVNYLSNNQINVRLRNTDTLKFSQKMKYILNDIALADSIINAYTKGIRSSRFSRDSAMSNMDIVGLLSYKDQLEDKLIQQEYKIRDFANPIEVSNIFIPVKQSSSIYDLTASAFRALLIAFAIGILLQGFKDLLKTK